MIIRNFTHPQIICGLTRVDKTLKYSKRKIKNLMLTELLPNDSVLMADFESPVTIKIQLTMYVVDSNSVSVHRQIKEEMSVKKVIRPCRISTLIRFILEDLNALLLPVIVTQSILVICADRLLKVHIPTGLVEEVDINTSINPQTLLIMETDPL